jgi:hypothetical protein
MASIVDVLRNINGKVSLSGVLQCFVEPDRLTTPLKVQAVMLGAIFQGSREIELRISIAGNGGGQCVARKPPIVG